MNRYLRVSLFIFIFYFILAINVFFGSAYAYASHKEPIFEIPLSDNVKVELVSAIRAYVIKFRALGNYTQRQGIDFRPTETLDGIRAMSAYLFRDTHLAVSDDGWIIPGDLSVTIWKDAISGPVSEHGHEGGRSGTLLFSHTFAMEDIPIWRSFEESINPTIIPFDEPITFETGEQYYIFFERDVIASTYAIGNGNYALYVPKDSALDTDPNISWIRCTYYGQCQTPFPAEIPFALYDRVPTEVEECCSSVLFLPGIQASRLYNSEGKLWEPGNNAEVFKLSMTAEGISEDTGVYTEDIILESSYCSPVPILCGFNIYKKFSEMLDDLVSVGTIKEWQAFPYDWRYSVKDIVNDGVAYVSNELKFLLAEIREMADESDTGKVTIVTHSNGGLLAKALIEKLREEGEEDIINSIIMVATPQAGTPSAIAGMLHGENQDLPKHLGWFMEKQTAREVASNFEGMYSLLPFSSYFNKVLDSPVLFDPLSETTAPFRDLYGLAITDESELKDFLLGDLQSASPRVEQPSEDSISTPYILNSTLFGRAELDQDFFASWIPEGIPTVQVVGWGVDTMKAIEYKDKGVRDKDGVVYKILDHAPIITEDGDGTVVVPSASYLNDAETFYVDLLNYNEEFLGRRRDRKHADILDADPVRALVSALIGETSAEGIEHIFLVKPEPKQDDKKLRLRIHSPVDIGITDSFGNYTGIVRDEAGKIIRIAEEIPNSYYWEVGEGKYLGLDTEDAYDIVLQGTGDGVFTFEIDEVLGDSILVSASFADVPVFKESKAQMFLGSINEAVLSVDIDGDGESDADVSLEGGFTADDLVDLLYGFVRGIYLPESPEKKISKDMDDVRESIEDTKKSDKKVEKEMDKLLKTIEWLLKKEYIVAEEAKKLENLVALLKAKVLE